jgi:hypothetical protein
MARHASRRPAEALNRNGPAGQTSPAANWWAGPPWRRYELSHYHTPLNRRGLTNLLDALHYIRQTAFTVQFSDVEYPVVVALQLLRKASYDGDDAEGQQRRVHAYRLADRIIGQLADEHLQTAARRTPDAA